MRFLTILLLIFGTPILLVVGYLLFLNNGAASSPTNKTPLAQEQQIEQKEITKETKNTPNEKSPKRWVRNIFKRTKKENTITPQPSSTVLPPVKLPPVDSDSSTDVFIRSTLFQQNISQGNLWFPLDTLMQETFFSIKQASHIIDTDIVSELQNTPEESERAKIVDTHVQQTQALSSSIEWYRNQRTKLFNDAVTAMDECTATKNNADNSFFEGIETERPDLVLTSYYTSQQNAWCAAEQKVTTSVASLMLDSLTNAQNILEKEKTNYATHAEKIIKNVDLFSLEELEELLKIRDTVRKSPLDR